MFEGKTGRIATWSDLMEGVAWADVVILGEEHDDAVAHTFQLAVVEEMLATWPRTAVALEMVERDEQAMLDAFLLDQEGEQAFLAEIASSEEGQRMFAAFYLPIINAAKSQGATVVGANAPRRYVRMARLEGYEQLEILDPTQRRLFDIPPALDQGTYRARIESLMRENGLSPTDDYVDAVLRAQQLWDRTMAKSVLRALDSGMTKVVLLVGRFHGDFDDGTIAQLHNDRPFLRVLYVSAISEDADELLGDDIDRADLVVYTGGVSTAEEPINPVDVMPENSTSEN